MQCRSLLLFPFLGQKKVQTTRRDETRLEGVICLAKWEESHLDGGKWKETTKLSAALLSRLLPRGSFERLVAMRSETGETNVFFSEEATSTYKRPPMFNFQEKQRSRN